jgi:hypothetical protein
MNTRINKTVLLIILMICLATAVYSAVGTFTFRTSGASDTTEVVDLRYPQKVPEDSSVTTDSIADGSITNDKLAEPVSVANGGTGATTAAAGLAALGGAGLNGSSTVDFAAGNFVGNGTFSYDTGVGKVLFREINLADDEQLLLSSLGIGNIGWVSLCSLSNVDYIDCRLNSGANSVTIINHSSGANTDTDGSLCVFYSGGYIVKNRLGEAHTFLLFYRGK